MIVSLCIVSLQLCYTLLTSPSSLNIFPPCVCVGVFHYDVVGSARGCHGHGPGAPGGHDHRGLPVLRLATMGQGVELQGQLDCGARHLLLPHQQAVCPPSLRYYSEGNYSSLSCFFWPDHLTTTSGEDHSNSLNQDDVPPAELQPSFAEPLSIHDTK